MEKINFVNYTTPALNATNLNKLQDNVEDAINEIIDLIYPVGSIYMSVSSTNPSALFGGTWISWGTGKVPVGVDTEQTEFNVVEKTGGEKTHTLTIDEMPSHNHTTTPTLYKVGNNYTGGNNGFIGYANYSGAGEVVNNNTGGGQAHNILQPYITCYMWKRTN